MGDSEETNKPGPQEAHIHGYKPMGAQPHPNGLITITDWFKDEDAKHLDGESFPEWERRQAAKFENDAKAIYEVLAKNLPGGTRHQLLIQMLQGSLNLFVVQDIPDTTIKDIADLARDYAWKPKNWNFYKLGTAGIAPELKALFQAVEKRYGAPPVESEPPLVGQEMYPYCVTCKECGPSHAEGNAAVKEFLSKHPSPDHQVDPKRESEIPR